MDQIKKDSIPSLTGLRFFAALFVCTAHMTPYLLPDTSYWYNGLTRISAEGMTLFFVLSGFVIHYNYSSNIIRHPKAGLYQFFVARFARLVPLYYACFLLDIYLTNDNNLNYSNLRLSALLAAIAPYYLTLTHTWVYNIIGGTSLVYPLGWIIQLSWSVSTEWFFYLMYPLICLGLFYIPKIRTKLIVYFIISIFAIGSVALLTINMNNINQAAIQAFGPVADFNTHAQDSFFRWLIYFSPYSRLAEFMLGCLTAALFMQMGVQGKTTRQSQITALLLTAASIILVLITHQFIWNPPGGVAFSWLPALHQSFGFAPACAAVIFCCARYQNLITRFLSSRLILLGGEISYSMYLLHILVMKFVYRASYQHIMSNRSPVSKYLITITLIFFTAYASYRVIEVPARRVIRRILLRTKSISTNEAVLVNQTNIPVSSVSS